MNTAREISADTEICIHPKEECVTWSINSQSGVGFAPQRQITSCTKCSTILEVNEDA
jgi:hypothetical protein